MTTGLPRLPDSGGQVRHVPQTQVEVLPPQRTTSVQQVPVQWHSDVSSSHVNPVMSVARVLPPWNAWELHPDNPNRMKRLPIAFLYSFFHHMPKSAKWIAIYLVGGAMIVTALGGLWNGRVQVAGPGYRNPNLQPANLSNFVPTMDYQRR